MSEQAEEQAVLQRLMLLRAHDEDIAEYIRLFFIFNERSYSMQSLARGEVARRLVRSSRTGRLRGSKAHALLQKLPASAELVCFLLDLGNNDLLNLLHEQYIDMYSINHYHVLYFCLHYKGEKEFRALLAYGYSPLVLDGTLLEIILENRFDLSPLFSDLWNYRKREIQQFNWEKHTAVAQKHLAYLEEQLLSYHRATQGLDYRVLNLALLWKAFDRYPLFDNYLMKEIKSYLI